MVRIKDDINREGRGARGLVIETVLVYGIAITLIRILAAHVYALQWWMVPAILLAAGLAPLFVTKRPLPLVNVNLKQLGVGVMLAGIACVVAFPLTYGALRFLASHGILVSMRSDVPEREMAVGWVFYQFFYVGVSEEVFFRGYIQANIQRILCKPFPCRQKSEIAAIIVSSCAFGAAHFIVFGHAGALLTVFPGLVLGWLYAKTHTLVAPIVFHGMANIFMLFC